MEFYFRHRLPPCNGVLMRKRLVTKQNTGNEKRNEVDRDRGRQTGRQTDRQTDRERWREILGVKM